MKFLIVVAALSVVASAAKLPGHAHDEEHKPIAILKSSSDAKEDGSYAFSFESEDGTKVQQSGAQKQITEEDAGSVSRGSYSYVHDGVTITVNWVADENGFQPSGAHLPVAPPMPDHVVKLLADLRAAGQL